MKSNRTAGDTARTTPCKDFEEGLEEDTGQSFVIDYTIPVAKALLREG
jgi:hypothetical protein